MSSHTHHQRIKAFVDQHRTVGRPGHGNTLIEPAAAAATRLQEPMAIVGLAGYLPGCRTHHDFWRALDEDRVLLEDVPHDRFTPAIGGIGGFIPDIRGFDHQFFGLLRGHAALMDPQLRLLLMAAYHAIEDAGHAPGSLAGSRTGVFVGYEWNEYLSLLERCDVSPPPFARADSSIANHVSYHLALRGTSEVVSATCASSALALHRAVSAIRAGEIDQAIVGGVNVMLNADTFQTLRRIGQVTLDRRVCSFGEAASGYARGEGVAAVMLRPLTLARRDGDAIYAVIRHTAATFNGKSGASIAAPDIDAHADVIVEACRPLGDQLHRLGYIEAQGLAQPLTDFAEWEAFNRAIVRLADGAATTWSPRQCTVSTLKPIAGHLHAASGLAALFKIVRSLQTRRLYRVVGLETVHRALQLAGRPCRLALESETWADPGGPRAASLHAFGATGTIAHVLIEEHRDQRVDDRGARPEIVPLSARTQPQLRAVATAIRDHAARATEDGFAALAFTLRQGRDDMAERVAFVASSPAQLSADVDRWLDDGTSGSTDGPSTAANGAQQAIVEWRRGGARAWSETAPPRRLHLPVYPFELTPCWHDGHAAAVNTLGTEPRTRVQVEDESPIVSPTATPDRHDRRSTPEVAVRAALGKYLGVRAEDVDLDAELSGLGFTSLLVTSVVAELTSAHDVSVTPTAVFASRTGRALVDIVAGLMPGDDSSRARIMPRRQGERQHEREPLAIVGLAGRFPGATHIEELWRNLRDGRTSIRDLPAGRWDPKGCFEPDTQLAGRTGKYYGQVAGFLDDVASFDYGFFRVTPVEAEYMHVKERLFMECVWHLLEDAGYTPAALTGEKVGVFVGVSKAGLDSYKDSFFSVANRVSYRFNFTGPRCRSTPPAPRRSRRSTKRASTSTPAIAPSPSSAA